MLEEERRKKEGRKGSLGEEVAEEIRRESRGQGEVVTFSRWKDTSGVEAKG